MSLYIEADCQCKAEYGEIMIAELSQAGFDYFMETEDQGHFQAYAEAVNFNEEILKSLSSEYPMASFSYSLREIPKENWNQTWETHYDPIEVDDFVYIRAHFHPAKEGFAHELVITPKMSFGTGHHATTWQMLKLQSGLDHKGMRVIDLGTGTGILAIMAAKLGAAEVTGTDIDDWSVENSIENAQINGFPDIPFLKGTVSQLGLSGQYDLVFANINKHVLLEEMPHYTKLLKPKGYLLLSGFYEHDIADLLAVAKPLGLKELERSIRNSWAALKLKKG
jgi:ribosomal protein L11 methyltransferase